MHPHDRFVGTWEEQIEVGPNEQHYRKRPYYIYYQPTENTARTVPYLVCLERALRKHLQTNYHRFEIWTENISAFKNAGGATEALLKRPQAGFDHRHYHLRLYSEEENEPAVRVDLTWTKADHEIFDEFEKLWEEKQKTNITDGYDGPLDKKPIIVNITQLREEKDDEKYKLPATYAFGSTLGTQEISTQTLEDILMKILNLKFKGAFAGNDPIHEKAYIQGIWTDDWDDLCQFDETQNINCATFTYKVIKEIVNKEKLDIYFTTDWIRMLKNLLVRNPIIFAIMLILVAVIMGKAKIIKIGK